MVFAFHVPSMRGQAEEITQPALSRLQDFGVHSKRPAASRALQGIRSLLTVSSSPPTRQ